MGLLSEEKRKKEWAQEPIVLPDETTKKHFREGTLFQEKESANPQPTRPEMKRLGPRAVGRPISIKRKKKKKKTMDDEKKKIRKGNPRVRPEREGEKKWCGALTSWGPGR